MGAIARRTVPLALAVSAVLAPFAAAPVAAEPVARAVLMLSVEHRGHHGRSAPTSVLLLCGPAGGTHPDPQAACAALEDARGQFRELRRMVRMCPMIVDPVTIRARGHWWGRRVSFTRTYVNNCVAARQTGNVFAF
ncbi:SSI family serine proteinase inhibitor [Streptantibioticus ferralitis]|uniref:SSI family serine proteinase inhibitor n=1 Tax=Streptantibioticus ferralitis TaxID=236510 RepID=A0ABT5Z5C1_9ACTN|nr:SSI family serine proteinase inhibitor [Streptantibioticus ferralitis]MDF2259024.1 SSI family serine proteinase inhibitor [Streptantibioticus ferralitis]